MKMYGQFVDDESELDETLMMASKVDPVQHAADIDLASSTLIPIDVVKRNRDELKQRERVAYVDTMDVAENSPKTAAFISNYDNAAVSLDHIDALRGVEEDVKRHNTFLPTNTLKNLGNQATEITGDFLQLVGHATDSFEETMTDLTGVNPGIEWGDDGISFTMNLDPDRQDDQLYGKMLSEYKPFDYTPVFTWENFKEDPSLTSMAGYIIEQGGGSMAHMAAAMLMAPAYVLSRTESIAEERTKNMGLDENPLWGELGKSFIPALAVAVSERFAGRVVLGKGGVTGLKSGAKATAGAATTEAGTEFIQEGMEYLGETVGTKKDVDWAEMFDRQLAGAVAGGGVGGTIRGTTATFEAVANRNGAQVTKVMTSLGQQDTIDKIVEYAQSENLDQVGPNQHKEFLQSVGEDIDIIISSDAVADLQVASEYFDNVNSDGDIHIPLDVFVSEIANDADLMEEIRPHLRTSEDGLTMLQMESGDSEHTSAIRKLLKDAEKEEAIKTEADAIYEKVKDQITATRRQGSTTAGISAQLIPAYVTSYVARARARGFEVTVEEAYSKMNLNVTGTQSEPVTSDILNQAVSQGYTDTSDLQAVEWNDAVDKGLLMDEESRSIRAAQMGVDFDQYSAHDPDVRTGPLMDSNQNFDDISISESIIIEETGETVQLERSAQDAWNDAQSRKSELQQLLNCVRGG